MSSTAVDDVEIKKEVQYSFIQSIQQQTRNALKDGLDLLKESNANRPKSTSKAPAAKTPRTRAKKAPYTPRPRPNTAGTPGARSKAPRTPITRSASKRFTSASGRKAKSASTTKPRAKSQKAKPATATTKSAAKAAPTSARKRGFEATASHADEGSPRKKTIYQKTTIAHQTRVALLRERKKMTPKQKGRFDTLGSCYYKGDVDSPARTEFMNPQSSLTTKGGYFSRTERPKPKVAIELGPLETIGLSPHVKKPVSTFAKSRNKFSGKSASAKKASATEQNKSVATGQKESVATEQSEARRRTMSEAIADGISSRLSLTNARIVSDKNTVITTAAQLVAYQMKRALQYLDYHLKTSNGQKVIRNIAVDKTNKESNDIDDADMAAAQADLTKLLGEAVEDHCNKWWETNMVDRDEIKIKPTPVKVPVVTDE